HYTDTSGDYNGADAGCEKLIVDKATPSASTVINLQGHGTTNYDANNGGPDATLASKAQDLATVTGNGVSGFDPAGTLTYTFYSVGDCTPGTGNANVITSQSGVSLATASNLTASLHAGTYSYLA